MSTCTCGCGGETSVVNGRPRAFIHGHNLKVSRETPLEEAIRRNPETGCWEWLLSKTPGGYGKTFRGGRFQQAHRWVYEHLKGRSIPDGLQLDHLCRNRHCVNPEHMEPVTQRENILRGMSPSARHAQKTHCKWGHEFTPENTYNPPKRPTARHCKQCDADRRRAQAQEVRP